MKNVVLRTIMYGCTIKKGDNYIKCHLEGEVNPNMDAQVAFNEMKEEVEKTLGITVAKAPVVANTAAPSREETSDPAEVETPEVKAVDKAVEEVEKKSNGARPMDDKDRKKEVMKTLDSMNIEYNSRWGLKRLESMIADKQNLTVAEKVEEIKVLPYDRSLPTHMEGLAEILDEEWPAWKEHIPVVKEHISIPMEGKPFIHAETNAVQDSFKEKVNELIGVAMENI
jgi:hypothetical protein